jgi:hypothetical protein
MSGTEVNLLDLAVIIAAAFVGFYFWRLTKPK